MNIALVNPLVDKRKRLEQDVRQTYKSNDTEEWLDRVFTRPIGYLWARFFQSLGVHPNVVTVLSISIGVSSTCPGSTSCLR